MKTKEAVRQVMEHYPRIFFACHKRHVRDAKTRQVLSSNQASILDHLDDVEATSLAGLAKHMGVTPSTMSIAVERLVRQGYVLRERDSADRRVVNLRLSRAGLRIKDSQSVLDPERLEAMLARLSPSERQDGVRGLAILARAAADEMHAQSTARAWATSRPGTERTHR